MATLADDAVMESNRVDVAISGEPFVARGNRVVTAGWFEYYPYSRQKDLGFPCSTRAIRWISWTSSSTRARRSRPPATGRARSSSSWRSTTWAPRPRATRSSRTCTTAATCTVTPWSPPRWAWPSSPPSTRPWTKAPVDISSSAMTATLERQMDRISEGELRRDEVVAREPGDARAGLEAPRRPHRRHPRPHQERRARGPHARRLQELRRPAARAARQDRQALRRLRRQRRRGAAAAHRRGRAPAARLRPDVPAAAARHHRAHGQDVRRVRLARDQGRRRRRPRPSVGALHRHRLSERPRGHRDPARRRPQAQSRGQAGEEEAQGGGRQGRGRRGARQGAGSRAGQRRRPAREAHAAGGRGGPAHPRALFGAHARRGQGRVRQALHGRLQPGGGGALAAGHRPHLGRGAHAVHVARVVPLRLGLPLGGPRPVADAAPGRRSRARAPRVRARAVLGAQGHARVRRRAVRGRARQGALRHPGGHGGGLRRRAGGDRRGHRLQGRAAPGQAAGAVQHDGAHERRRRAPA